MIFLRPWILFAVVHGTAQSETPVSIDSPSGSLSHTDKANLQDPTLQRRKWALFKNQPPKDPITAPNLFKGTVHLKHAYILHESLTKSNTSEIWDCSNAKTSKRFSCRLSTFTLLREAKIASILASTTVINVYEYNATSVRGMTAVVEEEMDLD
jgi:hypothetical protein